MKSPLLADVRQPIDAARQRVAQAVNAELTQLAGKSAAARRFSVIASEARQSMPAQPRPAWHRATPVGVKKFMKHGAIPINTVINSY